jgi:hypothetical protein
VTATGPEPGGLDPEAAAEAAAFEAEQEAFWQDAWEAVYGTPAEQAADAVEAEAEAIVAEAWSAYGTDSYFISGPDDPGEPEADL